MQGFEKWLRTHLNLFCPHIGKRHKKGKKEGPGISQDRTLSLSSTPGNRIEQNNLEGVSKHRLPWKVDGSSKHGFTKAKSCLPKLVATYSEVTSLVEKARAVDLAYLAFSKAQPATGTENKIHVNHLLPQNISSKIAFM